MKKQLIYLAASGLLWYNTAAQTTLTLQASKDAAIGYDDGVSPNGAGSNYGTAVQNAAFCIPGIDPNGFNMNRALIDFNLPVLPAGATLVSAHLNLYALSPYGSWPGHTGSANAATLKRITQSWQELTATWNNQPPATAQNQVTLGPPASPSQNYHVDVTTLVQDMLSNPQGSFGFKLQLVNEANTNILAFASKDHSNAALRPTLVIQYTHCTATLAVSAAASTTVLCPGAGAVLTASGAGSYTWTAGQQAIGQAASITVIAPGTYTVTGSDNAGCTAQAVITIVAASCTGINEAYGSNRHISIYPNPAGSAFKISSEDKDAYFDKIVLSDMQGRQVKVYALPAVQSECSVEAHAIAPGFYFCTVLRGSEVLLVKKLVITGS